METDKKTMEYKQAKKRVVEIKEFYKHLGTFAIVITCLTLLNAFTGGISEGNWWVQWVVFGWGIGILGHGMSVFGFVTLFGKDWEEKEIQKILEKEK